jgi:hypothetical protein
VKLTSVGKYGELSGSGKYVELGRNPTFRLVPIQSIFGRLSQQPDTSASIPRPR